MGLLVESYDQLCFFHSLRDRGFARKELRRTLFFPSAVTVGLLVESSDGLCFFPSLRDRGFAREELRRNLFFPSVVTVGLLVESSDELCSSPRSGTLSAERGPGLLRPEVA